MVDVNQNKFRPYADVIGRLKLAGLRPTKQRLALAKLLFTGTDRHTTAEGLHNEVVEAKLSVSLATVYNTLHQFTRSGLLREVVVDSSRAYFDTNISEHFHFFDEDTSELIDMASGDISLTELPALPEGCALSRVDVIVRVSATKKV